MNNDDNVLTTVSGSSGLGADKVKAMLSALPDIIKGYCRDLDAVAIPGFGTISSEKTDEYLSYDAVSGATTMMPPSVSVKFKSSVVLRKKFVG